MRRATGIATALFDCVATKPGKPENSSPHLTLVGGPNLREKNQRGVRAALHSIDDATNERGLNTKTDIGGRFSRLAELPTFALDRLSRFEHLVWRQSRQIVFALEPLRRRKQQPNRSSFAFSFRRRERHALSEASR